MKNKFTQRADFIDYLKPRIYMITMTTLERVPLLGKLECHQDSNGNVQARIHLTSLGESVNRSIENISKYYPQISILGKQVMPDHIHFIVYVREELPVHLGNILAGFKAGCNRIYRDIISTSDESESVVLRTDLPSSSSFWETGYHDRILSGKDQLHRMISYIHDNPRRLALKKMHSGYFSHHELTICGKTIIGIGNDNLLNAKVRLQVKCSRRISKEEHNSLMSRLFSAAEKGAVLVSPFISRGEREIEKEALQQHYNIIKIMDNGFSDFFKPTGHYFDLCASGKTLFISPFSYNTKRISITRTQCNVMNELAKSICE